MNDLPINRAIDVQIFDLSQLNEETYVFINVDIGRMPPHRARQYLNNVKESLELCRMLNDRNIPYSVIGCKSENQKTRKSVNVKVKNKNTKDVDNFANAMDLIKDD